MATFRGKEGIVKVGGAVVAERVTWTIDQTAATEEDSAQGDDWQTFKGGLKTWTGSLECRWDDTDLTGQEALIIGAEVALTLYPEGDATGAYEYSGNAIVTGVSNAVPRDDIVARSFTFQGNGELVIGAAA